ncbi:hypothetical protein L0222_08510 [bacterium]|nr:hypothetical protein [bacterium]MCI0607195.1 hypothetical protein [bacterium]
MKTNRNVVFGMFIVLLCGLSLYGQSGSTAAIQLIGKSKMQKANGDVSTYLDNISLRSQSVEQLAQGKFTIVLNPLSNGQYELQVYRMVKFGKKRVMSTFASLYQAGIEYSYSYDAQSQEIKQYHFICPPNSLTCWADPGDYASMKQFKWGENFPAKNCSQSVFTSEEYGREYLQASCFPNRDAALGFATKFVDHITSNRG